MTSYHADMKAGLLSFMLIAKLILPDQALSIDSTNHLQHPPNPAFIKIKKNFRHIPYQKATLC